MKPLVLGFILILQILNDSNGATRRTIRQVQTGSGDALGSISEGGNGYGSASSGADFDKVDADSTVSGSMINNGSELTGITGATGNLTTNGVIDTDGYSSGLGTSQGNAYTRFLGRATNFLSRGDGKGDAVVSNFGASNGGLSKALALVTSRIKDKMALGQGVSESVGDLFAISEITGTSAADENDSRTKILANTDAYGISGANGESMASGMVGELGRAPEKIGSSGTTGSAGNLGSVGSALIFGESNTTLDTDVDSTASALAISFGQNKEIPLAYVDNTANADLNGVSANSAGSGAQDGADPGKAQILASHYANASETVGNGEAAYLANVTASGDTFGEFISDLNVADESDTTSQSTSGNMTASGSTITHDSFSRQNRSSNGTKSASLLLEGEAAEFGGSAELTHNGILELVDSSGYKAELLRSYGKAVGDLTVATGKSEGEVTDDVTTGESDAGVVSAGLHLSNSSFEASVGTEANGISGGVTAYGDAHASGTGGTTESEGYGYAVSPGVTGNDGSAQSASTLEGASGAGEVRSNSNVVRVNAVRRKKRAAVQQVSGLRIRSMEFGNRKYWLTEEINADTGKSVLRPLSLMQLLTTFDLKIATDGPYAFPQTSDLADAVLYSDQTVIDEK